MSGLNVKLDASKLEAWARELSARGLKNAIRRAIDQSARFTRKTTIPVIAQDIGVSKSKIAPATPKVIATKAGDLSARWTVSKLRIGILNAAGASVSRQGGLSASTHRITGGGSASLHVEKAFIINANGGRFVAFRRSKDRLPVKAIYAESPSTALGQDGAAARVMWEKTASAELAKRLPVEIQKQFAKDGLGPGSSEQSDPA